MSEVLKITPLHETHIASGGKMVSFAGFDMPISYKGIKEEHLCVRHGVGVFDVSHMGEFIVRGREALKFLQQITSNDVSKLEIGEAQYSCIPNLKGGIVDDLIVYRLTEEHCSDGEMAYMMVVNGANIDKDWSWVTSFAPQYDLELINISDQTGLLAVQGPMAIQALQPLTEINLKDLKFYTHTKGEFAGIPDVLVSATGYTGAGGVELYVQSDRLVELWEKVFKAGAAFDMQPIGLGARDTLRLEKGYCLYGNDIDDETSPLEAGLGWITKLKKGDFNSSAIFSKQKEEGITKKLVGFKVLDRRVARQGYHIVDDQDKQIGRVTSGTLSPSLEYPIGMGYVPKTLSKPGSTLLISTGRKTLSAEVIKLPFL